MQESAQAFIFHFHRVCEKLCVPMFATVSRAEKDLTNDFSQGCLESCHECPCRTFLLTRDDCRTIFPCLYQKTLPSQRRLSQEDRSKLRSSNPHLFAPQGEFRSRSSTQAEIQQTNRETYKNDLLQMCRIE